MTTAGVHRLELAVHGPQQRIDHGTQFAQWVCLRHPLFEADVTEHRTLEVLVEYEGTSHFLLAA